MVISNGFIKRVLNRFCLWAFFCIILSCFLLPSYSLAATANVVSTIDLETLYTVEFQQAETSFINYLLTLYSNGVSRDVIQKFSSQLDAGYGVYFKKTNNDISAMVYEVPKHVSYSEQTLTLFNSGYTTSTNCFKAYIVTYYSFFPDDRSIAYTDVKNFPNENSTEWIPKSLLAYNDDVLYNFTQYVTHNAPNLTKIYEAIINVNNNLKSKLDGLRVTVDFSDLDINFQQIITTINKTSEDTQNKLNDVKKSIDDTNNFLKNTDTDDSDYGFSSDNGTNDITSDGLNSIFTTFYNCFANAEEKDIVFPLPFVNKSITIPSKFLENTLKAHGFSFVVDLARTVWLFAISCFIIKDVSNYVEKLKTGEILSKSDTNIKTDIL